MLPTDLTVAAVVRKDDQYLMIEETVKGSVVITQPGGHIESGESPEDAVVRETREESGCIVTCRDLIRVYLWIHPQTRQQFLRLVFAADYESCDEEQALDDGVIRRLWLSRDDIVRQRARFRTPVVLRCIDDFESGKRQSDNLFSGMLPLQHNVDAVIAQADLI